MRRPKRSIGKRLVRNSLIKTTAASLLPLVGALLLGLPWTVLRLQHAAVTPALVAVLAGAAILGAAFVLSWAAELAQLDISQALALTLLALIAVLPEYAVDAVFAYQAGRDPAVAQSGFAVANMTGANRLLIGLGWSSIVLVAWWRRGTHRVVLERNQALEMSVLLAATVYALVLPFKAELGLIDTAVLLALFGAYTWATARAPAQEPELGGPAATLATLRPGWRRCITAALFAVAASVIFISAEPFAHGLVETGRAFGIDDFLLVQWLAPLASEAPEFIVALLFVWRGAAGAGMRTLVSSKVNQWTLLIGTLPLVFSFGAGSLGGMPLVARQQHELWLTAAQSLFAIVLITDFTMSRWEGLALLTPFVAQLVLPPSIGGVDVHAAFTIGYLILGVALLLDPARRGGLGRWPRSITEALRSPTLANAGAAAGESVGAGASQVRSA
jgi:cation:H+ antiporter